MNSQTVTTGLPGSREQVLAAIAANIPTVWVLDSGYGIIAGNGASDPKLGTVTKINVLSASDAVRAIPTLQSQWSSVVQVKGTTGFAHCYNAYASGTFADNDLGDDAAAAAAVASAKANAGISASTIS